MALWISSRLDGVSPNVLMAFFSWHLLFLRLQSQNGPPAAIIHDGLATRDTATDSIYWRLATLVPGFDKISVVERPCLYRQFRHRHKTVIKSVQYIANWAPKVRLKSKHVNNMWIKRYNSKKKHNLCIHEIAFPGVNESFRLELQLLVNPRGAAL